MSSAASWEVRFSKSRQLPYFYDASSGASTWDKPEGLAEEHVASLPGAHLLAPGGAAGTAGNGTTEDKVRASHLLVKHRESRRPSSWKESTITRTPHEAEETLRTHASTLGPSPSPAQFAALAKTESDCSSASKGGDLGFFRRGQMQKPFEEAAFHLPVGQLSGIVKTESGHHLILRTA